MALMDQHRRIGVEILRASCAQPGHPGHRDLGQCLVRRQARSAARRAPIFRWAPDALHRRRLRRHDHRPGLSRGRCRASGPSASCSATRARSSIPDLVKIFAALHECDQTKLHEAVARRWLEDLDVDRVHSLWRLNQAALPTGESHAGAAVPAEAAGQHAGRGDLRRCQPAGDPLELRRRADDRHRRRQRLSARVLAAAVGPAGRRRRRDRRRRLPRGPRHPHGRAADAAADRAGPQPQGRERRSAHRARGGQPRGDPRGGAA